MVVMRTLYVYEYICAMKGVRPVALFYDQQQISQVSSAQQQQQSSSRAQHAKQPIRKPIHPPWLALLCAGCC